MIESQIVARVLPSKCREAVKVLLQEVYGYEDFGSPDKPGGLSIQLCKSEKKEFYIRYSS